MSLNDLESHVLAYYLVGAGTRPRCRAATFASLVA